ncbi:MAG: condensation domain-containing protein [Clostridia bacterium]
MTGSPSVAFIQYLRAVVLEAFNNQDYPFEELVNALKLPRSTNQNPLFTVCFVMQRICIIPIWS